MKTEKDYEEFLELLNKHNVRYCVIGAFALAFHARPRYTKDIDILIEPTTDNAKSFRIVPKIKPTGNCCYPKNSLLQIGDYFQTQINAVLIQLFGLTILIGGNGSHDRILTAIKTLSPKIFKFFLTKGRAGKNN